MLRELSVQNLALIEDARVELPGGYCAWSGDTGAGKSLLLTALGLVLGGKATVDLVRSGTHEARAAAVFEVAGSGLRADLESILGGPIEEDQLILTRRVSAQGRSAAHANGLPVAAATLRALGRRLIDAHGQHETRDLLDPDHQRTLLDAHGRLDELVGAYRERRAAHDALRRRRLELFRAADERRREQALLAFELEELTDADTRPGEFDELAREAIRLASVEQVRAATAEGYALLYEADGAAQDLLRRVARLLGPLTDSVPELADAVADLERLADGAREIAYALRTFGRDCEDDPDRLEEIETRLALYRRLTTRFRCAPDELAARREAIEARLAALAAEESDLLGLDAPVAIAWDEVKDAAAALSTARRKTAKGFAKAVRGHLKALSLAEARLSVEVESLPLGDDPTADSAPEGGPDRVEIVFAPNPGEPPRPLRRIASGGELSRITLAIKTVLAGVDGVPTLVFDEIDTGVGGRLGAAIGRKLADLSRHHQVICITHLPQVASFAPHQWAIRKETARGRTRTTITKLDDSARIDELAKMLRGDSAAEGTRKEALDMLAEAGTMCHRLGASG